MQLDLIIVMQIMQSFHIFNRISKMLIFGRFRGKNVINYVQFDVNNINTHLTPSHQKLFSKFQGYTVIDC